MCYRTVVNATVEKGDPLPSEDANRYEHVHDVAHQCIQGLQNLNKYHKSRHGPQRSRVVEVVWDFLDCREGPQWIDNTERNA